MSKKKLWLVGVVVSLLLLSVPGAQATWSGGVFRESFEHVAYHRPGDPDVPYWVILNGDAGQYYGVPCGDASCVTAEKAGPIRFARLQIRPDRTPGNYTGSEISELRTGYSAGQPGRWLPSVDHPVMITARVRFSSNYRPDGTGGAVGSAGFWLWNSYLDFANGPRPIEAFGFSWGEQGTWFGELDGLQIAALQDDATVYHQRLTAVQPDRWMQWTMIWSVDRAGQQSVKYWLDNHLVGTTVLPHAYAPLSFTFWNDNQYLSADQNGAATIAYHQPTAAQNFDVDDVLIVQP